MVLFEMYELYFVARRLVGEEWHGRRPCRRVESSGRESEKENRETREKESERVSFSLVKASRERREGERKRDGGRQRRTHVEICRRVSMYAYEREGGREEEEEREWNCNWVASTSSLMRLSG